MKTIVFLNNCITQLESFVWLIINYSATSYERVSLALHKFTGMVLRDATKLLTLLDSLEETMNDQLGYILYPVTSQITHMKIELIYIRNLIDQTDDEINYNEELSMSYLKQFHTSVGTFVNSLGWLYNFNKDNVNASVFQLLPDSMLPDRDSNTKCRDMYKSEISAYRDLLTVVDIVISNDMWYSIDRIVASDLIQSRVDNIETIFSCAWNYSETLHASISTVNSIIKDIRKSVNLNDAFKFSKYETNILEYTEAIKLQITHLDDLLKEYSENITTKLYLSKHITQDNVYKMENIMNILYAKMYADVWLQFHAQATYIERKSHIWYHGRYYNI